MAADGRVEIQVILEDGQVAKGVANINNQFDRLSEGPKKASVGVMDLVKSMGLLKIASGAFNIMKSSMDSAISRFDTMQKFPKVMKALGFSAEDSQKSIGKLSDGIDGLPTKLDDVVSSTQQMTAITGDLDRSTDTVLALNNAFLASGASTDDASRGMQQYNQMLSTGTVDLESWKTLQETMPLALQKTVKAMGFTRKSAQRDLYAALKEGTVTFDEFTNGLIKLGTGTGELATLAKENSLGIATSFGNLKNAVAKNLANIITKLDEMAQKITGKTIAQNIDSLKVLINDAFTAIINSMDRVTPYLISFGQWFSQNKEMVLKFATAIGTFIVAFMAISQIVSVITTVITAFKALKAAIQVTGTVFKGLSLLMGLNPFTLIIAAIAALVAAFVYLWNTNEEFKNGVIAVWNTIKAFLMPIITEISTFIQTVWTNIVIWWRTIQPEFMTVIGIVWNAIQSVIAAVLNFLGPFIQTAWEGIKAVTLAVWQFIQTFVSAAIKMVQDIIQLVLAVIRGDWQQAWGAMKNIVSSAWDMIKAIVSLGIKLILTIIITTFNQILNTAKAIWDGIGNAIKAGIEAGKAGVQAAVKAITGFLKGLADIDLFQIGQDVITGFVNGISNAAGWVKDTISGLVGDVTGWLKSAFKIGSPSRLMRDEIGKWLPPGIAVGVEKNTSVAVDSVKGLEKDMMKAINVEKVIGSPTASTLSGSSSIIQNIYAEAPKQNETIPPGTVFELPIEIKGDAGVWARGTARYTWDEIQKIQKHKNRNKGVLTT